MALPISLDFPAISSTVSNRATSFIVASRHIPSRTSLHHFNSSFKALTIRSTRISNFPAVRSVEEGQENSDSGEESAESGPSNQRAESSGGDEIKEVLRRRKEEKKGDLVSGVLEEIAEIEWPVFGKVLGTTGVVIGVIAGSSVVLLTVNAVLAELSDRVFAGKGVQDFFG